MFDWWKKGAAARDLPSPAPRELARAVRPPGGRYDSVCRYVENRYADTGAALLANREVAESFLGGGVH